MRRSVRFHPAARQDVDDAVAWYAQQRLRTATRFVDELDHVTGVVAVAPGRFPLVDAGLRRAVFRRFPHYVVSRADETSIEIIAVAHGKRRPRFWRDRM